MAPSNHAAWSPEPKARPLVVGPAPYPTPGPHQLVLRVRATAINPVDHLMQDTALFPLPYPAVLGEDVAGVVDAVGEGVQRFKVGQRVLGFPLACGTGDPAEGGFQEYVLMRENLCAAIPERLSFEQVAGLPEPIATAAAGLYEPDKLDLRPPQVTAPENNEKETLLVWGGASGVGMSVIQLARASGYDVVATASSHNHERVRKLGADVVVDYNASDAVDQLVAALRDCRVVGAYDSISKNGAIEATAKVLSQLPDDARRVIATVHPVPEGLPENVKANHLMAATIAKNGIAEKVFGAYLGEALEKGEFVPAPEAEVVGHGLERVQDGIDRLRKGVSAKKLVVTL